MLASVKEEETKDRETEDNEHHPRESYCQENGDFTLIYDQNCTNASNEVQKITDLNHNLLKI